MAPNTPTNLSIIDPTFDVSISNNAKILSLSQAQFSSVQQEHEIASTFSPDVTQAQAEPENKICCYF